MKSALTQFDLAMGYRPKSRWFEFAWGHFACRVESAMSCTNISLILGVMGPELGAKIFRPATFLHFTKSQGRDGQ